MKKITNTLCLLAIVAGLIVSAVAPWWAVWFICLPVIFAATVHLLNAKGYVRNY